MGRSSASLFAARNEFESFQVVITAGAEALRRVSVRLAAPLAGPAGRIPRQNVTVYREGYYTVESASDAEGAPGQWPDPLIPATDPWYGEARRAFPIDIPAGENRVVWVDIHVPPKANPGRYRGAVLVSGGGVRRRVPVELTVLRLALPSTASLTSAFGWTDDPPCAAEIQPPCQIPAGSGWQLKALFARAALDNRITISYPQAGPPTLPATRALFRRFTLPLLEGRALTRLSGARMTSFLVDGGDSLPTWQVVATAHGLTARAFVYVCDEPSGNADDWARCNAAARAARARWPGLSVLVTASIEDLTRHGDAGAIDILVPNVIQIEGRPGSGEYAGDHRPGYAAFLRRPGARLWFYTSCEAHGCANGGADEDRKGWPGYAIDAPAAEARAMGWLAFRYKITGELYWAVDHKLATAWDEQFAAGGNGDGTLFYPGHPSRIGGRRFVPIESLRLKLIRDGYEDYEYLRFLARRGRRPAAERVARSLFPHTYETARSDQAVQAARRRLARLVAEVTGGPSP